MKEESPSFKAESVKLAGRLQVQPELAASMTPPARSCDSMIAWQLVRTWRYVWRQ
jgi:hypothetical protein